MIGNSHLKKNGATDPFQSMVNARLTALLAPLAVGLQRGRLFALTSRIAPCHGALVGSVVVPAGS